MQFNDEKRVLVPEGDELTLLGFRKGDHLEWPVADAEGFAMAILAAKVRTSGMDLSEVPRGATFMGAQETRQRLLNVADSMQDFLRPYLPIVASNDISKLTA